jgi:hypothetical protein
MIIRFVRVLGGFVQGADCLMEEVFIFVLRKSKI